MIIMIWYIKVGSITNAQRSRKILDKAGEDRGLSYTDFALGYVDGLDGVVCTLSGMSSLKQMQENVDFYNSGGLEKRHLGAIREAVSARLRL